MTAGTKRLNPAHDRSSTPPNISVVSSSTSTIVTGSDSLSATAVKSRLLTVETAASYAASQGFVQRVEYRSAKKGSDILVLRQDNDQEFILRGVFQICRNDFYFTPDANYDPANTFNSQLQDVKLSCHLGVPIHPDFVDYAQSDFDRCIETIDRLEKMITHEKGTTSISPVVNHLDRKQFKMTHSLFEQKPKESESSESSKEPGIEQTDDESRTVDDNEDVPLGPEFAMETWPVSERSKPYFTDLFKSYDICPLPAFDGNNDLIPPTKYESMLCGATVEVHFAYTHVLIKKTKKHHYLPSLRKLTVLRPPSALPSSPYKRIRVAASPNKGKARAY